MMKSKQTVNSVPCLPFLGMFCAG